MKEPKRHLMFNMATGSGNKTMIMAALILDCYKKGYNNFIFFVNSAVILEKTKINFADPKSSKYLYSDEIIIIDSKRFDINIINNLVESKENAINIYFSTIQGLFFLFTNERENSITLDDLKGKKLVFLADEVHHLNASTKAEKEDELSWETIIKQAYNSNPKNLMYEFSATILKDKNVLEKYRDIIVFKYDLKKFCNAGYSKRILLSKYENRDIKIRFLGAVLLSLYREILANDNKISLKPVILFKSETIKDSQSNKAKFESLIENLTSKDIEEFYLLSHNNALFLQSKEYFTKKFGNSFAKTIVNLIKTSLKKKLF
ncbi:DEAD/DEAH box helicase family protein [Campylobacter portucalensis]|uniref:DEAD/DEAH box helicase family protein n=1 Tax=Campylobacter portucalensis TaxID=2608384 RepID=UPI0038992AD8